VIVIGMSLTSADTVLVAAAPGLGAGIALRALQGLTTAALAPVAFAYIAERIEPHRRTVMLSTVTTAFFASAVIAQVAAQAIGAALGWRAVFLLGGAAFAVMTIGLHRVLLPDRVTAGGSLLTSYRALPSLLRDSGLLPLYAATPAIHGTFVAIYTGVQLLGVTGLLGLRASALPAMLAIPFLAPWLARIHGPRRAGMALLLTAAAVALIGLVNPGTTGLAILLLPVVVGMGITVPGLIEAIGTQAGPARGTAVSLFTFLLFVGASVGPQIAGALIGHGLAVLAYVLAAALGTSALLALTHRRHA
jgi:predicted MFS family arabinose efflux permease